MSQVCAIGAYSDYGRKGYFTSTCLCSAFKHQKYSKAVITTKYICTPVTKLKTKESRSPRGLRLPRVVTYILGSELLSAISSCRCN